MKNHIVLICITILLVAITQNPLKASVNADPTTKTAGIDIFDTVFFDLTNAIYSANTVEIPVFIKTDDQVFALDFSTQFDLNKLTYDSLINLTPSLSPLAWFNNADSTLRMTSFSLSQLSNNTALVHVRFIIATGQTLSGSDFDIKNVLLNGESCTWYIIDPMNTSIPDFDPAIEKTLVYPNPCDGSFYIELQDPSDISVIGLNGQVVIDNTRLQPGSHSITIEGVAGGVYFVEIFNDRYTVTRRIVVRD